MPAPRGAVAVMVFAVWMSGCATAPAPVTAPAVPRHADFIFPSAPTEAQETGLAARLQQGWFRLQADDLRGADREFTAILKRAPAFTPAIVAAAYLDIARQRPREALALADRALARLPAYAPALAARGDALLALRRPDEALASFEAALTADASLVTLARRIDVLRFKAVEQLLAKARADAAAGRVADARAAYGHAIRESPDSALLYRELAALERRAGDVTAARQHLETAVRLDPGDARAQADLGDVFDDAGEFDRAAAAYRASLAAEPDAGVQARLARVTARARAARLPAEYRAIPAAAQITRADLAALIAVRFDASLAAAPQRRVPVLTDVRGHWAAPWIVAAIRAGVIDPLPNHTFQPRATVRRGELAIVLSRLLGVVLAGRPVPAPAVGAAAPHIVDVPPSHLMYAAVARVVAAGVLPLLPGDTFEVSRAVSGADAIAALDRVQALAGTGHQP